MFAAHRQALILQVIQTRGSVRIRELTRELGVTEMTVRRDLEVLVRQGLVEKVHGGAVLPGQLSSYEVGSRTRLIFERREITSIAQAAARLVEPRSVIALTGGMTMFRLAQCLMDVQGLGIITNSLQIASLFNGNQTPEQISLVVTGGARTSTGALVGPVADQAVKSLYFHTLFVSCSGIDPKAGLTTPSIAEAETNRRFIEAAPRIVALADYTKWGAASMVRFLGLDEADVLVTNSELPAEAQAIASEKARVILT